MGALINSKTQSTPQTGDEIPINRSGADFKISPEDFPDYLFTQGMLKGDPAEIYAENTADGAKWQIGQKAAVLTLVDGSPSTITPDCTQNDTFYIAPSSSELELQTPANVPSIGKLGGSPAGTFYFKIYARNASAGNGGFVSFASDYTELPGSKPYTDAGTNRMNIIHVWCQAGEYYYRIDNATYATGELIPFNKTITSAEILDCNTNPVEVIPAGGADTVIELVSINGGLVDGSSFYATDTSGYIAYEDQAISSATYYLRALELDSLLMINNTSATPAANLGNATNKAVQFRTETSDPTTGDYDLKLFGTYRIVDIS